MTGYLDRRSNCPVGRLVRLNGLRTDVRPTNVIPRPCFVRTAPVVGSSDRRDMDQHCEARVAGGLNNLRARMKRPALTIAICCLIHAGCFAQANESNPRRMRPLLARNRRRRRRRPTLCRAGCNSCNCWSGSRWSFLISPPTRSHSEAGEKFKLAVNNSVSLATIGAALVGAAYGQAINSPEGYGQGAEGYGKRFGSGMARAASDKPVWNLRDRFHFARRSPFLREEKSLLRPVSEVLSCEVGHHAQ